MYPCLREDHSSTPAERDNQERGWFFEHRTHGKALGLSVLLEVSTSPNVLRHVGSELHSLCGLQYQANGTLCPGYLIGHARCCAPLSRNIYSAPACLRVEDRELIVTPPNVMIPPFCCTSGLQQRASIVLGVCEGYDTIEAVSESGLVCTTSNCLPLPLPFLLFLSLFVLLLLLFDLSYAPPPGLQQSFTQRTVLPEFLQVLMSVLLVLLVRVPFWFLVFAFPLPLRLSCESRLASCCHHPHLFHFQLTRSRTLQSLGKNNTIATKLFEERHCLYMYPTANCFQGKLVPYSSSSCT